MRTYSFLLTLLTLVLFSSMIHAKVVEVFEDFQTIQEAIDACINGDTVIVHDGIYTGDGNRDIDFTGKAIVLMSENGPEVTIIDCEGSETELHRGFYFHSGEDTTSILQGFTIRNGMAIIGGGILCRESDPTIRNNIIESNAADWGGGIFCHYSDPNIMCNIVRYNIAHNKGGGIRCHYSSPWIHNNLIEENMTEKAGGGGILMRDGSHPLVTNNIVRNNQSLYGGGICCGNQSGPVIRNNIITGNQVSQRGGGVYCTNNSVELFNNIIVGNEAGQGGGIGALGSDMEIKFCTIADNSSQIGGGIYAEYSCVIRSSNLILWKNVAPIGSEVSIYKSDFFIKYSNINGGYPGKGNIDSDPMFFYMRGYDYLLQPGSPSIDAGDPLSEDGFEWPEFFENGLRADMGAYGGPGNLGWLP